MHTIKAAAATAKMRGEMLLFSEEKIAAITMLAAMPSAKPSARNSISEVKIDSPVSTKFVTFKITSGKARKYRKARLRPNRMFMPSIARGL